MLDSWINSSKSGKCGWPGREWVRDGLIRFIDHSVLEGNGVFRRSHFEFKVVLLAQRHSPALLGLSVAEPGYVDGKDVILDADAAGRASECFDFLRREQSCDICYKTPITESLAQPQNVSASHGGEPIHETRISTIAASAIGARKEGHTGHLTGRMSAADSPHLPAT
jgi:hypothetical protein